MEQMDHDEILQPNTNDDPLLSSVALPGPDDPPRQQHQIAIPPTGYYGERLRAETPEYEIDIIEDLPLPDELSQNTGEQLPKIGNYQLLKCTDETTQTFEALDMNEFRFVTAKRLEYQKHQRRLILARRLAQFCEHSDDWQRVYELLCPSKAAFELFKQKDEKVTSKSTSITAIDCQNQASETAELKLFYYWFEPPHHGSLHAYVIERKRLPEMQTKEYFRQICQIVEFCHSHGVIIRDLKLRKFVFADARREFVKLDDLDETAICPETKSDLELTNWDDFDPDDDLLCDRHGCPAYVSPEILDLSKKWYSGKSADIWSLGVLLYVLLVGRYPFYDLTPAGLFTKIRQARVHIGDSDGVRMEARLLIRSMIKRDPKERPTISEILAHPWLKPKDYRSDFKEFDCNNCCFWKNPQQQQQRQQPPMISGPAAAAAAASAMTTISNLVGGRVLNFPGSQLRIVPQVENRPAAKIYARRTYATNGGGGNPRNPGDY